MSGPGPSILAGTPKNSPTSNRSAGEGRGVSREPESGDKRPVPSATAGLPLSGESLTISLVACQRQKYSPTANTGGTTQPDAPNQLPQGSRPQARNRPSGAPLTPSR